MSDSGSSSTTAAAAAAEPAGRWAHINKLTRRNGPLAGPGFVPDTASNPRAERCLREEARVLVVGAGGLGCEILKDLALSGFRRIDVIDMDTIDPSNLNRQFLFRGSDVGKSKAEVAARFVNTRVAGAQVTAHCCRIEEKPTDFYRQFRLVVLGLDSVEARRWMNATLCEMVQYDEAGELVAASVVPLVDGGTEGLKGNARVVLPRITACIECSLEMFPPQRAFPLCTLANTPRLPEHCVQWASLIHWPERRPFDGAKLDADDPQHMAWLFAAAERRAADNGIRGVSYKLTQGVVKNIIPAVAASNALIAAACCNEAFKIATDVSQYLNNFMFYNGGDGVFSHTLDYQQNELCAVCGTTQQSLRMPAAATVADLLDALRDDPRFQLKRPSLRTGGGTNIYMRAPPVLEKATAPNLPRPLRHLLVDDDRFVTVTDPALAGIANTVQIVFDEDELAAADAADAAAAGAAAGDAVSDTDLLTAPAGIATAVGV